MEPPTRPLFGLKFLEGGTIYQPVKRLWREYFSASRQKQFSHIFPPDAKTSACNTSNHLEPPFARWLSGGAQGMQMLDASGVDL